MGDAKDPSSDEGQVTPPLAEAYWRWLESRWRHVGEPHPTAALELALPVADEWIPEGG